MSERADRRVDVDLVPARGRVGDAVVGQEHHLGRLFGAKRLEVIAEHADGPVVVARWAVALPNGVKDDGLGGRPGQDGPQVRQEVRLGHDGPALQVEGDPRAGQRRAEGVLGPDLVGGLVRDARFRCEQVESCQVDSGQVLGHGGQEIASRLLVQRVGGGAGPLRARLDGKPDGLVGLLLLPVETVLEARPVVREPRPVVGLAIDWWRPQGRGNVLIEPAKIVKLVILAVLARLEKSLEGLAQCCPPKCRAPIVRLNLWLNSIQRRHAIGQMVLAAGLR